MEFTTFQQFVKCKCAPRILILRLWPQLEPTARFFKPLKSMENYVLWSNVGSVFEIVQINIWYKLIMFFSINNYFVIIWTKLVYLVAFGLVLSSLTTTTPKYIHTMLFSNHFFGLRASPGTQHRCFIDRPIDYTFYIQYMVRWDRLDRLRWQSCSCYSECCTD